MSAAQRAQHPAATLRHRAHRGYRDGDAVQPGRGNLRQRAADIRDHHTPGTTAYVVLVIIIDNNPF